ncbi:NAD(P)-dependent alcohol dehydrogenase [Nocardia shimofusensis]|uniref:NAD(P)-dependent alcohol dehydrogenase n=1 Tax=Nocardia shimofusensis TaxID=228596 RepID=UPI0008355450|nr:NAD(P)-dependent alcohol dehydrogenase [Nocardia shimofusensis]
MHALQVTGPGTLELRTVPVPDIGPAEVLLRVGAAGICHSDLRIVALTEPRCAEPFTLGHEISGTVEAVGAEVATPAVGARGVVYPCWSCGVCRECLRGNENVCLAAGRAAIPPCPGLDRDGGMAEYVRIPARAFVSIGDLDFLQAAPLADAALTSYHAVAGAREQLLPGATAVVIGVGGLGHMAVQILAATTAARVVAVDLSEDKLALATANGADEGLVIDDDTAARILDRTGGRGAEAVFDFVGVDQTARLAVESVAPNGAYRMIGLGGGAPEITSGPAGKAGWPWGASVRKSYGGTRSDLVESIALAQSGKLRVEVEPYELTDGREALDRLEHGLVRGRAVLVP